MLAIIPLGSATDWYFRPCTRLCPLYTIPWFWSGRQIGRTVPSVKPKQLCNGLQFCQIAGAYVSRSAGFRVYHSTELFCDYVPDKFYPPQGWKSYLALELGGRIVELNQ